MSDPSNSPNEVVSIDGEVGEIIADLMRECATEDVIHARRQYEATGHTQTGVSRGTLENTEIAALLLEGHQEDEVYRLAEDTWNYMRARNPGYSDEDDSLYEPFTAGEEYIYQTAKEMNEAVQYRKARRLFLRQDSDDLAKHLDLSLEELKKTLESSQNDPAKQKLLNFIPGTEEEVAEKITRATEAGSEDCSSSS